MKAIIIASGTFAATPPIISQLQQADLRIAADGGACHLHNLNIVPHVIIGDLDSISQEAKSFFISKNADIFCHPVRKDQTDTELCIDYAIQKGATQIILTGVTGHRMDHTLANVFLLKSMADRNIKGSILDEHNEIHLVTDTITIHGNCGDLLSLVPVSEKVGGVTLWGLEYPLENETLEMGTARGVSNVFKETTARVQIDSGLLLVIRSRD